MLTPFPGLENIRLNVEVDFWPWEWAMEAEPDVIETRIAEVRFVVWPGTNDAVALCSFPDAPNFGQAILQFSRFRPWRLKEPSVSVSQNDSVLPAHSVMVVGPDDDAPKTLEEVVKGSFQILPSDSKVEEVAEGHMLNITWIHVIDLPELPDAPRSILSIKYELGDRDVVAGSFLFCTWCSEDKLTDVEFVSPWSGNDYDTQDAIRSATYRYKGHLPSKDDYEFRYIAEGYLGRDKAINIQSLHDILPAEWNEPNSAVRYSWECSRLQGEARLRYAKGYDGDFSELQHIMELVSRLAVFYFGAECITVFRKFHWNFNCVSPVNNWSHYYRHNVDRLYEGSDTNWDEWQPETCFQCDTLSRKDRDDRWWEKWNSWTNEPPGEYDPVSADISVNNNDALMWFDYWNNLLHSHFVPRCWEMLAGKFRASSYPDLIPRSGSSVIGYTDQVGTLGFVDFSKVATRLLRPEAQGEQREQISRLSFHEQLELQLQLVEDHRELRAWLEGKVSSEEIDLMLCEEIRLELLKDDKLDFLRQIK